VEGASSSRLTPTATLCLPARFRGRPVVFCRTRPALAPGHHTESCDKDDAKEEKRVHCGHLLGWGHGRPQSRAACSRRGERERDDRPDPSALPGSGAHAFAQSKASGAGSRVTRRVRTLAFQTWFRAWRDRLLAGVLPEAFSGCESGSGLSEDPAVRVKCRSCSACRHGSGAHPPTSDGAHPSCPCRNVGTARSRDAPGYVASP
jgi:hypothetical protein